MLSAFRYVIVSAAVLLIFISVAPVAGAQAVTQFDLPAQPLDDSLRAIARQTSTNVLFDRALVNGRNAPALKGHVTIDAALAHLLVGTGLRPRAVDEKTIVLEADDEARDTHSKDSSERSQPISQSEPEARVNVEEIVVTGSRRAGIDIIESMRPVDVVTGESLMKQGASNLNDALRTSVVSLNVQKFVAQDSSAFVRPFSLRGLPPDQTLVLVNGKRRHRSAVIQITNQPLAAGAQGPDLATIPAIAIDKVEVLRDGAAAQYGSDAIAGVINFRLKDARDGFTVVTRGGQYYASDGEEYTVQANAGLPLGVDGFFNVSGEYVRARPTSRGVQRPDAQAAIDAGNTAIPVPAQRWGNIESEAARMFFNSELPISDSITAYLFGGYSRSVSESKQFYRGPFNRPEVFRSVPLTDQPGGPRFSFVEWFPGGFNPLLEATINDASLTSGLKGRLFHDLSYDLSAGTAQNELEYRSRTVNPSLGPDSPTSFRPATVEQRESRVNADFAYSWHTGLFAEPLNVAFGAEYRRETFEVTAGNPESYEAGPFARVLDPNTGDFIGLAIGTAGFIGYGPETAGTFSRDNWAAYLDLETDLTDALSLGAATRYEDFSDFGDTFNWKISGRYELTGGIAVRASINTGFRAPTPGQSNLTTSGYAINAVTGDFVTAQILPPTTPISRFYGAQSLAPEESKNYAAGIVFDFFDGYVLTVDYFNIEVTDRIALTSRIFISDADRAAMAAHGISAGDTESVRYFNNAFDTRTEGIDAVFSKSWLTGSGSNFSLSAAANYTTNEVTKVEDARAVDRERSIEIDTFNPKWRGNIAGNFVRGRLNALVRANYYGEWTDAVPNAVPTVSSFDQTFSAEWLFDMEVGYDVTDSFNLTVGAENVFDAYPDKDRRPNQQVNGLVYPQFSPFGFSGAFWYVRGAVQF